MKRILIHSPEVNTGDLFDPHARDNSTDTFISLREHLRNMGYELATTNDCAVEGSEWVLFIDAVSVFGPDLRQRIARQALHRSPFRRGRNVYRECLHAGLRQRVALILSESPAIMPQNASSRLHGLFPVIFTWHDGLVDGRKFYKLRIPQPHRFPAIDPYPYSHKKLLVNISANKYSFHPRELYSERRKSIRHFERARPDDFDLYGFGWNEPSGAAQRILRYTPSPYTSYQGPVAHKWDVFPRYRFALCYENVRDEPGYITEKIFDCMRADCVPIYWGAANVADSIPTDAFIDRRRFNSNEELERYLVSMSEVEYEQYRSAIRKFLASDRFSLFLGGAFVDQIIQVLGL